jgi:erythrocyte band 7 integral membrane protein
MSKLESFTSESRRSSPGTTSPLLGFTIRTHMLTFYRSNSVTYFQVTNPHQAAFGTSNPHQALVEHSQTTLRRVVTEREVIAFEITGIVGDITDKWGVSIEGILINDITFSPDVAAFNRRT